MYNDIELNKVIDEFREKVDKLFVGKTPKWLGKEDEMYNCDILLFRHPGMGNCKQVIRSANKVSIFTITASYLESLVRQGVFNKNDLDLLFNSVNATLSDSNE